MFYVLFFTSLRKPDGAKYCKQSLEGIKYSVNRILAKIHGAEQCDILKDKEFAQMRDVFKSYCKTLKAEGKNCINHFEAVPLVEVEKMQKTLSPEKPDQLQLLVWLNIMLYFCRRGVENLIIMTKDTFKVKKSSNGRKFIFQHIDEESKNHKTDSENAYGGRIYENLDLNQRCPVKLFEKYINKLNPKCGRLWQRPKDCFCENDSIWYQNRPIGKSVISTFMSRICQICDIETKYTNHCLRVTCINMLKANFSDADVMSISGHKSLTSLKIYERTTEKEKEDISDFISSAINKDILSTIQAPSSSHEINLSSHDDINFLNNIDFSSLEDFDLSCLDSKENDSMSSKRSNKENIVYNYTFNNCTINR